MVSALNHENIKVLARLVQIYTSGLKLCHFSNATACSVCELSSEIWCQSCGDINIMNMFSTEHLWNKLDKGDMNWRADETYWIRQTYLYSWDVIQFIYQGSLLCTHCVRQQSPSTPDNAEVLPSAITSSRKSNILRTSILNTCRRTQRERPHTMSFAAFAVMTRHVNLSKHHEPLVTAQVA